MIAASYGWRHERFLDLVSIVTARALLALQITAFAM